MKTYSQDLRERVVRACDAGELTHQEIARVFGVSTAWIRRLLQRRRETGAFAAKPHAGGPRPKLDARQRQRLLTWANDQPDATLAELRDRLLAFVHVSTVHRALHRAGLTFKKKRCTRPNRSGRTCDISGLAGLGGSWALTRRASCSSTKPGPTRL